jgi:SpoIID/LytB domain protein
MQVALALPASLRVKLFEAHGRIESVKLRGPFQIVAPNQKVISKREWVSVVARNGNVMVFGPNNSHTPFLTTRKLIVQPLNRSAVRVKILRDNIERAYLGQLSFSASEIISGVEHLPSLNVLNHVPTIEYVASVVGSESPLNSPPEATKALAVLVISIVEHKGERSLVGDSTKEQAYKGCEHATPAVFAAVKSVYDKRLLYRKSPIQVFFHSTCAGGTSSGADIFGEAAKSMVYLAPVKCVYCTESPFWKTKTSKLPMSTFKSAFSGNIPTVTRYDSEKRPVEVLSGEGHMSGYEAWLKIGRTYGWGIVPGTRFTLRPQKSSMPAQALSSTDYVIATSSGAGHGVGLCQWGAVGLAKRGKRFDEILKFYFPGCEVALQ